MATISILWVNLSFKNKQEKTQENMLTTRAHSQVEKQMAKTVRRCTFSVMYSVYLNSPSGHFGLPGIQNQGGVQTTTQILFHSGLSTKYLSRPHAVLSQPQRGENNTDPSCLRGIEIEEYFARYINFVLN